MTKIAIAGVQEKFTVRGGGAAPADDQLSMGDLAGAAVLDTLRNTAVETLTPIEAMNLLYQLQKKAKG